MGRLATANDDGARHTNPEEPDEMQPGQPVEARSPQYRQYYFLGLLGRKLLLSWVLLSHYFLRLAAPQQPYAAC